MIQRHDNESDQKAQNSDAEFCQEKESQDIAHHIHGVFNPAVPYSFFIRRKFFLVGYLHSQSLIQFIDRISFIGSLISDGSLTVILVLIYDKIPCFTFIDTESPGFAVIFSDKKPG